MHCPHCGSELSADLSTNLRSKRGVCISGSGSESEESEKEQSANSAQIPPRRRGKALEYSATFEIVWRAYGRKNEKLRAYLAFIAAAKEVGGETRFAPLILRALAWQGPQWAADGWRFAPYFERYITHRKWEDEPLPAPVTPPKVRPPSEPARPAPILAVVERFKDKPAPPEEQAAIRALRNGAGK